MIFYKMCCVLIFVFLVTITLIPQNAKANDMLTVTDFRTEYKINPVGIDVPKPRLSWKIESDKQNTLQTAYEIKVARSRRDVIQGKNLLWKTSVESDQSVHVIYDGPVPVSGQRFYWQVKIQDNHNRISEWSEPAFWEMGLLSEEDWSANWIQARVEDDTAQSQPAQYFRKSFTLDKEVQSARLYITAHGLYEVFINGERVGDQVLTPGWTSYNKRLQYQVYDVTDLLQPGEQAIGAVLGDGWYRGYLGWKDNRNIYGKRLALLAQLKVDYADNSRETILTDTSWKATNKGPILMSDIYMGETCDARKEMANWTLAGFDDSDWNDVAVVAADKSHLIASAGPPVKITKEITPINILTTEDGKSIVDMGQNMVGWLRLRVNGRAGDTITMRHAEVLDKEGNLYTKNLRTAKQTITYICKGGGEELFEPRFTFQGFRFVEVSGYPGELKLSSLTGMVVHSDMDFTGRFSCSDSLINQLQHNIEWGLRGNFVDVPTDCPQRDERLGWTGDAQVFASTACFNVNAASFYAKWMKDLAADQGADGKVTDVVPDVLNGNGGHTGWGDAAVIVPWTVYLNYGDRQILQNQYESMKAWIGYMETRADDDLIWQQDWHYGDWLSFDDSHPAYMGAYTETDLIATAYFAYSTGLMYRIAEILGKREDAQRFKTLAEKSKNAFIAEFVTPNGRLVSDTQTAYTLALAMDLIPDSLRPAAAGYLNHNVNSFKHITTGFLGTPLISQVLTENGYTDTAYMLLNRKEYPSWLYPVTMGATTIWERWDGMRPDSTFQDHRMNSFNHYAYGAIGKWLYSTVAGIDIDAEKPGYKHIIIHPRPGGGLTSAQAFIETVYGTAASQWKISEDQMILEVTVPANTTAEIHFPGDKAVSLNADSDGADDVKALTEIGEWLRKGVLKLGSGHYRFQTNIE
ncbi:Bacterial alpha-L-rhamnosidase [candidate division KSB1 bacterium]|nr:Bacterial alpha-L-rhamnosidase [candidate division KSB1 bacterium]